MPPGWVMEQNESATRFRHRLTPTNRLPKSSMACLRNLFGDAQAIDQGAMVAAVEHRAEEALLALRVHIIGRAAVARLDLFVGRAGKDRHAEQGVNLPAGDQLGAQGLVVAHGVGDCHLEGTEVAAAEQIVAPGQGEHLPDFFGVLDPLGVEAVGPGHAGREGTNHDERGMELAGQQQLLV